MNRPRRLLVGACLLAATAACGGRGAIGDPLAPVPVHVAGDEVEPPPLRVEWKWIPQRDAAAAEASGDARERERALARAERATRPAAVGQRVVAVAVGTSLRAHRVTDGAVLWRTHLASPVVAGPLAVAGAIVAATQAGDWLWLEEGSGDLRAGWHADGAVQDLAAAGSSLVVAFADRLIAVTPAADTGEPRPLWSTELRTGHSADEEATRRLTVSEDGTVVYLSWRSGAAAFAVASGRELWRRDDLRLLPVRAAVGPGRVFLVGADSVPIALSARDGHGSWRGKRVGSFVVAAPAYADGVVWLAGLDAALHGYSAATGSHLFRVPLAARCRTDLVAYDRWILAGPGTGPWTIVRAPLRPASPSDPGRPRTLTVPADGDIEWPAATGPAGVALTDAAAALRLLRPGVAPYADGSEPER